jgi:hypothetical protein
VDQHWPAEPSTSEQVSAEAAGQEPGARAIWSWQSRPHTTTEEIRYLLACRLARANRLSEAGTYYPQEWRPFFEQLHTALSAGQDTALVPEERARGYFAAAKITRKFGLELVGTELGPDWRIHAGNYQEGVTASDRANQRVTNVLAASSEETSRAKQNAPTPERRWHYRYTAGALAAQGAQLMRDAPMPGVPKETRAKVLFESAQDIQFLDRYAASLTTETNQTGQGLLEPYPSAILAWKAASLLPDNSDDTARVLCKGGFWIRWDPKAADIFYKSLVRRCRKTAIGAEADRLRWFPSLDEGGNLKTKTPPPSSQ